MSDISPLISAELAFQEAVFGLLVNDSVLVELLGGAKIYDRAPEGAIFPYITFAGVNTRDASTASESGLECRLTLNIWSRYHGKRQALDILQRIRALLEDGTVALSHHVLVNLMEEFADVSQDRDRLTYRGLIRYRAFIETMSD